MHGENNFYAGLSEDISEGGIFIATHQSLPIGTPVVLTFTLPDAEAPLEVHGTVQWVRGPDATTTRDSNFGSGSWMPGVMPGIGVKFQEVDAATLDAIHSFVTCRRPVFFDC